MNSTDPAATAPPPLPCPGCAAPVPAGARFCPGCGTPLPGSTASAADAAFPPRPVVAGLGVRALARLLDVAIVLAALVPITLLANVLGVNEGPHFDQAGNVVTGNDQLRLAFRLLTWIVVLGYEPLLVATHGATLGKRALHLRVLRRRDGALPGWGPSVARWVLPVAAVLACFVGELFVYLSAGFDRSGYNRGWHDRLAGTVVVRD